jgi:hypothetical protein
MTGFVWSLERPASMTGGFHGCVTCKLNFCPAPWPPTLKDHRRSGPDRCEALRTHKNNSFRVGQIDLRARKQNAINYSLKMLSWKGQQNIGNITKIVIFTDICRFSIIF